MRNNQMSDEESLAESFIEMLRIYPDFRVAVDKAVTDFVDALRYNNPMERLLDPELRIELRHFDPKDEEVYVKTLTVGIYHNMMSPVGNPMDVPAIYVAKKRELDSPRLC